MERIEHQVVTTAWAREGGTGGAVGARTSIVRVGERPPIDDGDPMAHGIVLVFEGLGADQYWAVNERLGINTDRSDK